MGLCRDKGWWHFNFFSLADLLRFISRCSLAMFFFHLSTETRHWSVTLRVSSTRHWVDSRRQKNSASSRNQTENSNLTLICFYLMSSKKKKSFVIVVSVDIIFSGFKLRSQWPGPKADWMQLEYICPHRGQVSKSHLDLIMILQFIF